MIEEWKPVVGFEESYKVSNHGRVKSLARIVPVPPHPNKKTLLQKVQEKILKPYICKNSYHHVTLYKNGRGYNRSIHRLVLQSFVGIPEEGKECCHNDGNGLNNKIDNLRWDTRTNNNLDTVKHGNHYKNTKGCRGSESVNAKFTEKDVINIRSVNRYRGYVSHMAELYGVTKSCVWNIIYRYSWRHIP